MSRRQRIQSATSIRTDLLTCCLQTDAQDLIKAHKSEKSALQTELSSLRKAIGAADAEKDEALIQLQKEHDALQERYTDLQVSLSSCPWQLLQSLECCLADGLGRRWHCFLCLSFLALPQSTDWNSIVIMYRVQQAPWILLVHPCSCILCS